MKRVYIPLFVCFLLFCCIYALESVPQWTLLGDKNHIQYYEAPVTGSKFNQFKGVALVDAGAETIIELLRDIPAYEEWMMDCKKSELIEAVGKNDENICYYVYDSQWPVKDRDSFVKSISYNKLDRGIMELKVYSINDPRYKPDKDHIKMEMHVTFTGEIIGRNKTRVTLQFKFVPGGTIGPGLVHGFIRKLPYVSLMNLKNMVKQPRYIELGKKCKELPQIEAYAAKVGK